MRNSKKDEYEHKLFRFVKELQAVPLNMDYDAERKKLLRKYGFTEEDELRSYRIVRHISLRKCFRNGLGLKKIVQINKDRSREKVEQQEAIATEAA